MQSKLAGADTPAVTPADTSTVVNTPEPTPTEPARYSKGVSKACWKFIVAGLVSALLLLVVAGVLVWYFLSSRCLSGVSCNGGGHCISPSQWCDGVMDCPGGQDEAQCFRLHGPQFVLQAYGGAGGTWKPVCAKGWGRNFGLAACGQIGYDRETYVSSEEVTFYDPNGYMHLATASDPDTLLQQNLVSSEYCSGNRVVSLRCIECGTRVALPGSRIVGGEISIRGAWPWQVSLWAGFTHMCGGSIITPYWIVTAAHCLETFTEASDWTVYAGFLDQYDMFRGTGVSVSRLISNTYDGSTSNNDVALMKLSQPLKMSDDVKPVCLPNFGQDFASPRTCWTSGWGAIREMGPSSQFLRDAEVPLINRSVCNSPPVYDGAITEAMICAGFLQGGVDSCQGDSGGPLVTEEASVWWLVGDTSWGHGCARPNSPGVYGYMPAFLEWIYQQMQKYR
ncbi:transmembrane protease serine 2 [Conger conger]|uniref:transmembrane protease serine 2 n=1 Tax=Conger conger TaxID=82655 RepID=UPI002A59C3AD|nr:transmembrane protease serine 2 [Conger conger]